MNCERIRGIQRQCNTVWRCRRSPTGINSSTRNGHANWNARSPYVLHQKCIIPHLIWNKFCFRISNLVCRAIEEEEDKKTFRLHYNQLAKWVLVSKWIFNLRRINLDFLATSSAHVYHTFSLYHLAFSYRENQFHFAMNHFLFVSVIVWFFGFW